MRRRGEEERLRRRFAGVVVVVTGAGSGIGRAIAERCARLGARVHASDLDGARASAAQGAVAAHACDVSDEAAVRALADAVFAAEGRVDVLFNNAGIGGGGPLEQTPLSDWRRIIEIDLMGVVHGVHHFVPRMKAQPSGGHVVNTASMLGVTPAPGLAPYCAAKHGVVGLTEALQAELAPDGVTFTALCPGIISTAIVGESALHGEMGERKQRIADFYAKRGAPPERVADDAVRAVLDRKLIATSPPSHVALGWGLSRLSPRLGVAFSRLTPKLIAGR